MLDFTLSQGEHPLHRQYGAGKASLALDQLAGKQDDEHNADEVSGTSGQAVD
jgi:hypothetical protein